jgi:hypothetical protein
VQLQHRELRNLICCGALDGLGESRHAMLLRGEKNTLSGTSSQLHLWSESPAAPESEGAGQRFDWEMEILGAPISVNPLDLVELKNPTIRKVSAVDREPGKSMLVAGYRIPGWSGGNGFFLADADQYIQVKVDTPKGTRAIFPKIWKPIVLDGNWEEDKWGMGWLTVRSWQELNIPSTIGSR